MARPRKEGLDYYPHDIDMSNDEKIKFLEARHGIIGYGILNKIYERIYRNGYFIEWNDRNVIMMAKETGVDSVTIGQIVETCLAEGIFHRGKFEVFGVLTSKGIQKRFAHCTAKRQNPFCDDRYRINGEISTVMPPEMLPFKEEVAPRVSAKTSAELNDKQYILRADEDEFKMFVKSIEQMIASENQGRPVNRFTWLNQTGSFERDMKMLVYKTTDEEKIKILSSAMNLLSDSCNWLKYVGIAVTYTVKASDRTKIASPFGFTMKMLKQPEKIARECADGILKGIQ